MVTQLYFLAYPFIRAMSGAILSESPDSVLFLFFSATFVTFKVQT